MSKPQVALVTGAKNVKSTFPEKSGGLNGGFAEAKRVGPATTPMKLKATPWTFAWAILPLVDGASHLPNQIGAHAPLVTGGGVPIRVELGSLPVLLRHRWIVHCI